MSETFDSIEHITISVHDLEKAVKWYLTSFSCQIEQQTSTLATLRFHNIRLMLSLPNQEPPHLGVERHDARSFGLTRPNLEQRESIFVSDPSGNLVELVQSEVKI